MTTFAEVRLESGLIIYGTKGGSAFSTDIVTVNSGFEFRNKNWQNSRGRWEFGERKVTSTELHSIEGFFRNRGGRFQGFRFKDWGNYKATRLPLTELNMVTQGVITLNAGSTTVGQMYKKTTDLSGTTDVDLRRIAKPILATLPSIYKAGALLTITTDYTLDLSTGFVTFLVAPGASALTWEGEFDTPVRFDTDSFQAQLDAGLPTYTTPPSLSETYYTLFSLPLIEIRTP